MATATRKTPIRKAPTRSSTASTGKVKPASKPATKPVTVSKPKAQAKSVTATQAAAPQLASQQPAPVSPRLASKAAKVKKAKLVRDSFTIPKAEYAAIDTIKQRAAKMSLSPKKSELLRAGLMLLTQLEDAALVKALSAVPAIKTGRPKA